MIKCQSLMFSKEERKLGMDLFRIKSPAKDVEVTFFHS